MRTVTPLLAAVALSACAAPDLDGIFHQLGVAVAETPEDATQPFLDAIDDAEEYVAICVPTLEDQAISDALIAAAERGIEVEVVTDYDEADDAGIADLVAAGIPVTLSTYSGVYFLTCSFSNSNAGVHFTPSTS